MNRLIDLSQKIEITGFSGTIEQLLKQLEADGTRTVSVAMSSDLFKRLENCREKGLKTRSAIIREALNAFFEREEL